MTIRRMVFLSRLKPECVQEYLRLHQQIWPELLAAYREAGITQISCFLSGADLVVYSEYEEDAYERKKEALSRNLIEVHWQALMKGLRDPDFVQQSFKEVFHWYS